MFPFFPFNTNTRGGPQPGYGNMVSSYLGRGFAPNLQYGGQGFAPGALPGGQGLAQGGLPNASMPAGISQTPIYGTPGQPPPGIAGLAQAPIPAGLPQQAQGFNPISWSSLMPGGRPTGMQYGGLGGNGMGGTPSSPFATAMNPALRY